MLSLVSKLYGCAMKRGNPWIELPHPAGSREYAQEVKEMLDRDFPEDAWRHEIHESNGWFWVKHQDENL